MAYILSQVFVVLAYALMGATYLVKNKNHIFLLSSLDTICFILSYILVGAWSGMLATIVGLVRNLIFFVIENKGNSKTAKKIALSFVFLAICACAVITYDGVSSIIAVVATTIYTIGLWNEKGKIYRICGIMSSVLWIVYNALIHFYLSIMFELVVITCAVIGLIKAKKKIEQGEI